ncbi:FAD-dependent oxidoreductase [Mycobacterium sp. NPDC050551]|uniref:FAD-dependent oxidoreductase n=1 Tax=Mycobacterium sp. NPDC050551 TaxID=3155407 RepID=UPI0034196C70
MNDPTVLIVGAGPTGLAAALELSRLGVDVRIVDRAGVPSATSRALGIQARTVELLRPRGVGDELLRLGNRARATALYARGGKLAEIELHRMASDFNYVLLLDQSETERVMTEQLGRQGCKVERGVEVTALHQHDDSVAVHLRTGQGRAEIVRPDYVIAADGAHSVIRKATGVAFEGRQLSHSYVLGDLSLTGEVPEDQLSIFLGRRGFLAVFPMGAGHFRFMATDPDGLTGDAAEPTLAGIQQLYDRTAAIPARLVELRWSSRFRINSRHAAHLRAGRVFLGGDAAHVHSPAGGQGMNAGIQDMVNLSWKLALVLAGRARPELLDTYESDRLPVIRDLVTMTERATAAFNSTSPLAHAALTRLAPLVLRRIQVQRKAADRLGQLSAGYRGAPLSADGGRIGDLRAGDRVPDAAVVTADGEHRRLHDLIDLAGPTLFVFADDEHLHTGRSAAVTVRRLASAPTITGDPAAWLLVRPDGYLAAAGTATDADRLRRWVKRWLTPDPH